MSAIAPLQRRPWLVAIAGVSVALAALLGFVATQPLPNGGPGPGRHDRPPPPLAAEVPQANWDINVYAAGRLGPVTKKEKGELAKQSPRVAGLVRDIYGALYLDPARLDEVTKERFTRASAQAFSRARAGPPRSAHDIETLKRSARVGVKATGARVAVAAVDITLRGKSDRGAFRMRSESTLWLSRDGRGWKVVAFEIDQGPRR